MKKFLGIALVLVLLLGCVTAFADDAAATTTQGMEVSGDSIIVGSGDIDKITTINGHKVGAYTIAEGDEQTCTKAGKATFVCTDGGQPQHFHIVWIRPDGHTWSSEVDGKNWGRVMDAPTCQKDGYAEDECTVCGEKHVLADGSVKTRIIEKTQHEYDYSSPKTKHQKTYVEPTCTTYGWAQHTCIYCGEPDASEILKDVEQPDGTKKDMPDEKKMIRLDKLPHDLTDWNIKKTATCAAYGVAERTCIKCDFNQRLYYNSETDYNDVIIKNADGTETSLLNTMKGVAILNPNWPTQDQAFDTQALYDAFLARGVWDDGKEHGKFEYAIVKDWLVDCYTEKVTLKCPYCGDKKGAKKVHADVTVTLSKPLVVSHKWLAKPDKDLSTAPTCTTKGYNVYLCENDPTTHQHSQVTKAVDETEYKRLMNLIKNKDASIEIKSKDELVKVYDLGVEIEEIPKLGHDFSDWEIYDTYTKNGEEYQVLFRSCKRVVDEAHNTICGYTENLTVKASESPLKPEKTEDPKTEDPKTEDPKTEDPKTEDPKTEDPKTEDPKTEDPKTEDPKTEEPKTEEPKTEEPKTEEPKTEEPTEEPAEKKNGLCQDEDGKWKYFKDDEVDTTKTDIVDFQGGKFWVVKGELAEEATGLVVCPDGEAYLMYKGQILYVSQIAMYDGQWFMVKDGKLDKTATGLYEYDGSTFAFKDGRIAKEYNGLYPDGDKWVFLANGQVQEQFSGVTIYDDHAFLLKNGTLDKEYEGEYVYDGATFIVVEGQLYPAA